MIGFRIHHLALLCIPLLFTGCLGTLARMFTAPETIATDVGNRMIGDVVSSRGVQEAYTTYGDTVGDIDRLLDEYPRAENREDLVELRQALIEKQNDQITDQGEHQRFVGRRYAVHDPRVDRHGDGTFLWRQSYGRYVHRPRRGDILLLADTEEFAWTSQNRRAMRVAPPPIVVAIERHRFTPNSYLRPGIDRDIAERMQNVRGNSRRIIRYEDVYR